MRDQELLEQLIARLGRQPRAAVFDEETGNLVELNLAGLDLEAVPDEVYQFVHLRKLWLGELEWEDDKATRLGNCIRSLAPAIAQCTQLEDLRLDNNAIVSLPDELAELVYLKSLRYENNGLESIPSVVGRLAYLETLCLSTNQLLDLPAWLFALHELRSLMINDNQLTSVPIDLGQLVNLQTLDLNNNQLASVPVELGQLANLQLLDLSENQITSVPVELGQLDNLQGLYLWGNKLTSVPVELGQLVNLQYLYLLDNQLASIPVEFGQLTNLQVLSLSNNQLTNVPAELGQLTNLQRLYLSKNQLMDIPVKFGQLANLQRLRLFDNQLASVPVELGQLAKLQELDLHNNHLANMPIELSQFVNLQWLSLRNNRLTSMSSALGQLTNLQTLDLSENQLTNMPVELGQLVNLQVLGLRNNQLTSVPIELGKLAKLKALGLDSNRLMSVPVELGQLANLQFLTLNNNQLVSVPRSFASLVNLEHLDLNGNPLRTPPLEIAGYGAAAVREFLALLDERAVLRREAKLLLVGEGHTGKSSLLRALQGLPFDDHLDTTHGIDVRSIDLPHPQQPGAQLRLHVWDFGGQHIYGTTHQFFMTRRSLYVLVWNARGETDQGRLDHWLQRIQVLAPEAPVLLVATHSDERAADFNFNRFQTAYPQIAGFVVVSNKTGAGIEQLKAALAAEAARLPLMEQEWPHVWVEIEEALQSLDRPHISGREFAAICAAHGVSRAQDQQVLGSYLHDLGKILYYQDDDVLCDFVVLKPNWLTQAMARVLDDTITRDEHRGVLEHGDFPRLWQGYDRWLCPVFLRMLERFLISYELPDPPHRRSLVPLLLPHREPEGLPDWATVLPGQPEVRMVFDLDFVPPGIMSWFIVLTHEYSQNVHWREGVRLRYEGNEADVRLDPSRRQLWLHVRGPVPSNFFNILQHTVNDRILRRYFTGLTYRRRIPCLCHKACGEAQPCSHFFDFDKLVERKQKGRMTVECDRTYEQVAVAELLEGIHYTTQDRLEARLDAMQETLTAKIDATHDLMVQNQQLTEQLLRESMRMWNLQTQKLFSEAPSVFILSAHERWQIDPRNLFNQDYQLHLLCQHPAGPHTVEGEAGYNAPKDREWWRQVAPWLRQLARILKFVPELSGVAKAYDEQWYKTVELNAELFSAGASLVPDFDERLERTARAGLGAGMGRLEGVELEPEGAALRALHTFLNEQDKTKHWCGLQRVITNDGNILWLCPEHARLHSI